MWRLFNKKPELDPEELLPLCTRCFYVGAVCEEDNERNSFCHMCGSGGSCIPIKRKYIGYLSDRVFETMKSWHKRGREQGTDLQEGDEIEVAGKILTVKKVDRSVINWQVHCTDGSVCDYTTIKKFTRKLNGQNNFNRP